MNTNDFNSLIKNALSGHADMNANAFAEMIKENTNVPDGMRTPFPSEIMGMQEYARLYKKQTPKASKREVRLAVQKQFNVTLLK